MGGIATYCERFKVSNFLQMDETGNQQFLSYKIFNSAAKKVGTAGTDVSVSRICSCVVKC